MTESKRATPRVPVSLTAGVQVCDPESLKPLSDTAVARLVDVGAGGVKLELELLSPALLQVLGPGVVLSLRFQAQGLTLAKPVYLTVSWFRSRMQDGAVALASLGGFFSRITEEDRGTLLAYSARHGTHPPPAPRWPGPIRWGALIATLALIALCFHDFSLQNEVAGLNARVDQLQEQLDRLQPSSSVEARVPGRPLASALAVPPVVVSPRLDAGRPTPPRNGLAFEPAEKSEGLEMTQLELLNGDFVGVVEGPAGAILGVVLDFACDRAGEKSSERCRCETPALRVPPAGRIEFACTPTLPPKAEAGPVAVHLVRDAGDGGRP